MLRDFYYSDDRRLESAVLALEEAALMTESLGLCKLQLMDTSNSPLGFASQDRISQSRAKVFFRR